MSEVDRLSNSGLYPTLPIADRQRQERSGSHSAPDGGAARAPAKPPAEADATHAQDPPTPPPPRSRIDEYV